MAKVRCERCDGSGKVDCQMEYGGDRCPPHCPSCHGRQKVTCPDCNGAGKVEED